MTRVALLRFGYGAFAAAFLAFAGSAYAADLVLVALLLAFVGAILLALSRDDLPKWAGLVLLAYFVVSLLAWLAAQGFTFRKFARVGIDPVLPDSLAYYAALASPVMLAGCALAASWERERPARFLVAGALGGFIVVALLTVLLDPGGSTDPSTISRASSQASMLRTLLALSALAGAIGAGWAAARPEELA